jgi:hypothetical protein
LMGHRGWWQRRCSCRLSLITRLLCCPDPDAVRFRTYSYPFGSRPSIQDRA